MKIDAYTVTARIFPGILCAIPFFILHFFYLRPVLGQFWGELLAVKITSDATILIAFLFLHIQVSRYISKEFYERRIFKSGFSLPTTDYLLHSDSHFSRDYTNRIHAKIKVEFGIDVLTREEELQVPDRSRQLIAEAVTHVRAKVGEGKLTGQHNAEYGFVRNLVGGSVIGLLVSIIDGIIFSVVLPIPNAFWISFVLALLYLLVLIFANKLITAFGHSYAKVLIQEYMSM